MKPHAWAGGGGPVSCADGRSFRPPRTSAPRRSDGARNPQWHCRAAAALGDTRHFPRALSAALTAPAVVRRSRGRASWCTEAGMVQEQMINFLEATIVFLLMTNAISILAGTSEIRIASG